MNAKFKGAFVSRINANNYAHRKEIARSIQYEIRNQLQTMSYQVIILQGQARSGQVSPVELEHATRTLFELIQSIADISSHIDQMPSVDGPETSSVPGAIMSSISELCKLRFKVEFIDVVFTNNIPENTILAGSSAQWYQTVMGMVSVIAAYLKERSAGDAIAKNEIFIEATHKNGHALIKVFTKDNGSTLKALQESLFSSFHAPDGPDRGRSIEMAIVNSILEELGGQMGFCDEGHPGFLLSIPEKIAADDTVEEEEA